jgi:hypothetical protein
VRTRLVSLAALALVAIAARTSAAEDASTREAGKHFQRGVALYSEADYHAALVEFKRAYALVPNSAVLFNVGETQYQLQDYASALTTLERWLTESSANDPRRAEVEGTVEVLRSRVGYVTIVTVPAGVDVTLDDQVIAKASLDKPVLVSIGRRKVVASMTGRAPVTRYVDVAADDNVTVTLQLPAPAADAPPLPAPRVAPAIANSPPAPTSSGGALRVAGWITVGTLASGTIAFGLLASKASGDLEHARAAYPTSNATLSHDASLVTMYATIADALGAACLVVGGITIISSLSSSSSSAPTRGSTTGARVSIGPASARVELVF